MKIYKLIPKPNNYTCVHIVGREYDHFKHLEECCMPKAVKWGNPIGERTGNNNLKIADYTSMGVAGMMAVSERVKQLIYDYCRESAEFLPARFDDENMYCINVTNVWIALTTIRAILSASSTLVELCCLTVMPLCLKKQKDRTCSFPLRKRKGNSPLYRSALLTL